MFAKVHSLDDLVRHLDGQEVAICLYSGGLDSSFLLHFIQRETRCRPIALHVFLGSDATATRARQIATKLGVEYLSIDHTAEFACGYVAPAIKAQSAYLGGHPICASLSRPLMAQTACEIAVQRSAGVILHTSTRSQNSLRRFNTALHGLAFPGVYGSPFEDSEVSRDEKIKVLSAVGIQEFEVRKHSSDTNFWGREVEYGDFDDPENIDPDLVPYLWTGRPWASEPASVRIRFTAGVPTHLDGAPTDIIPLVNALNERAGRYGVGRYIGLEEIEGGQKVQEIREMPAACLLLDTFRRLETATLPAETIRVKMSVEQVWVREAIEGRWFGLLRRAAESFIDTAAAAVCGEVHYRLTPGCLEVLAVQAENPLYVRDRRKADAGCQEK